MINLSKSGDTIVFEFINNGHYLENGTIEVPVNSLSLVTDSSNMATFYRADSHDIFISATYDELGKTKAEMLEWFEENMVGGGGIDSGAVQTQIDQSISGFADSVLYNSTSKYVEFYHGGSGGTKVYEFDASDFVIDGMVDDVRIETISGTSYLVIHFNTASGKEDIQIPLTNIFDPSNYYTKTETNTLLGGKQDTLSAGTNITIVDNVISAEGGGKAVAAGTNISITTGETADTINCTLSGGTFIDISNNKINCSAPIRYGTRTDNVIVGSSISTNKASGMNSIANGGDRNTASGQYSYAEGYNTQSTKHSSHSEGWFTIASGNYSHTEGNHTKATNESEHASGKYNVSSSASTTFGDSGNTLFSVGNGTADNARHNAFEIRQNGDIYLTKDGQDVKLQDQLGGGSITVDTALDSGSTNPVENRVIYNKIDEVEQVTAAALNSLSDNFNGLKLKKLSQAQYDALSPNYDNNTLYVII